MRDFFNREYCVAVCETNEINCDILNKNFKVINNGAGYWAADPFPVEIDGVLYIFAELFEYSKIKGSIGYTKKTDKGFTEWKKIIEEPYHLSFPNVFCIEDTFYMCPEAHESGAVYLYKCIDFPEKWVRDQELFKSDKAVDTIFFKENDQFYGMSCIWEGLEKHRLEIYRIKKDKIEFSNIGLNTLPYYLSRPAGKIFYDKSAEEQLVVSQICKPIYGSGLIFKKFCFNWPHYSEEEYKRILPSDITCDLNHRYDGIHTFNATEHYIVVDLAWSRINIYEKICRAIKKIRKIAKKGA